MFRIVQTLWIDQLRAREVRKEDGDVAEERLGSDSAVRTIEARLALAEVRRAVQFLPPDQRTRIGAGGIFCQLGVDAAARVIAAFRRSRFGKEVTDEEIKQALA